jgi:Holliday junction resolvasome RuvABC ATP-dependent DNA helicase subunit
MSNKIIVVGWDQIAEFTPFSTQTVIRKFGPEMLRLGFVLKSKTGRSKRPRVWAFPSQIMKYFTLLGQKGLL